MNLQTFSEFYSFTIASYVIRKCAQPILILTKRQKKLFLRQVIESKTKTKTKISKFYKCLVSSATESTYVKLAKKEQKKKIAKNVRLFISN